MSKSAQFVKPFGRTVLATLLAAAGCMFVGCGETASQPPVAKKAPAETTAAPQKGKLPVEQQLITDVSEEKTGTSKPESAADGAGTSQDGAQTSQGSDDKNTDRVAADASANQSSDTQDTQDNKTTADQGAAQDADQDRPLSRAEIDWDAPIKQPPEAEGMKPAFPDAEVWSDREAKKIVMAGRICQNSGPLEFFATLRGYQEHEAIATIKTKSSYIHALLLSMGINPGHPVQFRPEFKAAEGPEISVTVYWTDKEGERKSAKAQDWVKNFETGKPLEQPFVFGGSMFFPMEDGKEYYAADDGYLICVANFPSALMDLPVTSSDSNANLLFEAFEERMPPVGTEIAIVLEPVAKEDADKADADKADAAKADDGTGKTDGGL